MSHLFSSGDSPDAARQDFPGRRLVGDLFISIALVAVPLLAVNLLFLSRAPMGSGASTATRHSWRHAGASAQVAEVGGGSGRAYRAARPQGGSRP